MVFLSQLNQYTDNCSIISVEVMHVACLWFLYVFTVCSSVKKYLNVSAALNKTGLCKLEMVITMKSRLENGCRFEDLGTNWMGTPACCVYSCQEKVVLEFYSN